MIEDRRVIRTPYSYIGAIAAVVALLLQPGSPPAGREWHSWCGDPGSEQLLGWHFYCDRAAPEKPSEGDAVPPPAGPSATAEIERMRQELEESRATAILEPTPGNVAAYLYLQQESLQRASTFSTCSAAWSGRRPNWTTR